MNREEIDKQAEDLIEQAKQRSKEKFLNFTQNIYGTNKELWDHLWKIPIVTTYEYEKIFPAKLSSIDREQMLDVLDECIENEIGNAEAAFVIHDNIISELPSQAIREYDEGVDKGIIPEEYNAVIIYNEAKLKNNFRELIEEGKGSNPPKSQEEINEVFLNLVSETFVHERMHLNTNALVIDAKEPELLLQVNGAERVYDIKYNEHIVNDPDYQDYNEVLLDTMAKIIQIYSKGDTIEDCLYRIIKERSGKSSYADFDDRIVLALFTLFTDELSEWIIFETYYEQHNNLFAQKYMEVLGENEVFSIDKKLEKVGEYFNQAVSSRLNREQLAKRKEMLEVIGVRNIKLQQSKSIDISQLRDLATSETAMKQLYGALYDVKTAYEEMKNKEQKEVE